MKILVLSPYEVYPPNFGGQVRIYSLAKNLAKLGNNVTIASNQLGFILRKEFIKDGVKIKFFKTYIQDIVYLLNKFNLFPLIVSYPLHKLISYFYKYLFVGYDIIQFEQPFLSCWMDIVPKQTLKVYSSQNVELDFDLIGFKKSMFYSYYKKLLLDCEKTALEKSDLIIAVSQEDKMKLQSIYKIDKNKIVVVENGFESTKKQFNKNKKIVKRRLNINNKVAVFVGSLTIPNVKAVKFIENELAPKNPHITFLLIGESANVYKSHLKNVRKIGRTNDLNQYLSIADIGLLPVTEGSGSNLKLLSYLKFNLQVLSTEFGVRGYKELRKYITILPLREFSNGINKLSEKKVVPKLLLKKFEWKILASKLNKIYKQFYLLKLNENKRSNKI